ncbi:MAG TPA: NAD(P)H-hydrate dehydratase [Candidatus Limnocylindrales bacterium]|nr:NAD(P)H-hydrate dehydratase [Candidatus Limnocylindrales bacterium]
MHLSAATCAPLVPIRDADGHKGTFGTLVCVCGSLDYAGAALLCGMAAARAGAGLVALAVPASLQPVVAGRVPELVTIGLPETEGGLDIDPRESGHALNAKSADALVVGCGLRESEGSRELVVGLVAREGSPMVVDGGALNLLSRSGEWWSAARRECVLTPHPGEFERLMGTPAGASDGERLTSATRAAERFGQVVVLKGARTVVAAPDGRTASAPFANAALATAGSGDVLAGTIGSLLAQGVAPFDAACLGVYLHGRAAERVSERVGDSGLLASDLPYEIALARRELVAQGPR